MAEIDWRGAQADYEEQGFAVLRGLLPTDVVLAARTEYQTVFPDAPRELPEGDEPLVVLWYHAANGFKRYLGLSQTPAFAAVVSHPAIVAPVTSICNGPVRLFETIIFNKPPGEGGNLAWHQDASFYPLAGGIQLSALVMLDPATEENGAVSFAAGSHKSELMSAVDLHTGDRLRGDERAAPDDPAAFGFKVVTPLLDPGDVVLFHNLVWHGSGPNRTQDRQRRLLSLRYASLDTCYQTVPGNSASFMHQIKTPEGQPLSGSTFPIVEPGGKLT